MKKQRLMAFVLAFVMLAALVPAAGAANLTPTSDLSSRLQNKGFAFSFGQSVVSETEPNDNHSAAQKIQSGQTISGKMQLSASYNLSDKDYLDMGYYTFTVTKTSSVLVYLVGQLHEDNFLIDIEDTNGNTLRRAVNYGSSDSGNYDSFLIDALDPGTYWLVIMNTEEESKYNREEYMCYFETIPYQDSVPMIGKGLSNFKKTATYPSGQFTDVASSAWYAASVKTAYEYGLVNGRTSTTFDPSGNITIAETIALACRIHSTFSTVENDGSTTFQQGSPWYQVYVDYAIENGIIKSGEYTDYTKKATRAQFASIMAASLPSIALMAINKVESGSLPDVSSYASYATAVYRLYNAGILTGSDAYGTFNPSSNIKRSEVATIVTRMADPSQRKSFTLEDQPVAVTSISLNKTSSSLYVGATDTLSATVSPSDATSKSVTWSSSNSSVATVSSSGVVTAKAAGTATITAKASSGVTASATVTVTKRASVSAPNPTFVSNGKSTNMSAMFKDKSGFGFYRNSVDGVYVGWMAINQSGKVVNYYTCYFTMYNSVGDLAYDSITKKATASVKVVGPVPAGDSLLINRVIGYSSVCSKVVLNKIYLEYADGTTETVTYGYSGQKTLWNKYYNKF